MKKIILINCANCPHRGSKGDFGKQNYRPWCMKKGRHLPSEKVTLPTHGRRGARVTTYQPTHVIPTWCPLEDINHD